MDSGAEQAYIEYERNHIDESHIPGLIAGYTISLVLACAGAGARIFSRHLIKSKLQADDYLILCSLLFTGGFIIPNYAFISLYNFGRHEILVSDPIALAKGIMAVEISYTAGIFCFKSSICCLFYRLFPVRWFRISQISIISFVGAYSLTQVICIFTTCVPFEGIWNTAIDARCININAVYIVISALNILTDAVIILLPMPLLWGLNASRSRKIQLTVMFGLGTMVFIASVVRITQLPKVSLIDPSYSDAEPAIWGALEMALGTLGASMPTYKPLGVFVRGGRAAVETERIRHGVTSKRHAATTITDDPLTGPVTNHRTGHSFARLESDDDNIALQSLHAVSTRN